MLIAQPPSSVATQNLNVVGTRPIIAPKALKDEFPATPAATESVVRGRAAIRDIVHGRNHRLLAVVGPCSVHDVDAARVYAEKLAAAAEAVSDQLLLVMRVYFEKPRTTVGWKGLINDPNLDGTFDMNAGLKLARKLMLDIAELGLPIATELLDPYVPQYIDDLLSWAAIGARTTESQTHRQMASGLSMPVGFKNSTDGSVQVAIDAMKAARSSHHFLGMDEDGRTAIFQTRGNTDGHVILRGGSSKPNFDPENVSAAAAMLEKAGLNPLLMVDCSHANSSKKHENQAIVWQNVVEQKSSVPTALMGVMLESNLHEGRQDIPADLSALKYGVSVTDACISWEQTESLLHSAAESMRQHASR